MYVKGMHTIIMHFNITFILLNSHSVEREGRLYAYLESVF